MNPESATAAVDGVVLLHGWGGSADSDWEVNGWCRSLARRGRTPLAVDLPGHGHRPQSHDPGDYADLASEIMAALPDGGRLDGIGFSLGAKVLLEIAARHPHRFRRLVAGGLGGNVFAPEPLGHELAGVLETGDGAEAPAAVRELAQYGVGNGNDPLAMAAVLRRAANPLLTPDRLTRVRCPVLLVAGENDPVARPVQTLADALPDARVRVLAGVAHLDLPASAEFQRLALAFLGAESAH
ncbi:alpha/beta fold hydrolase [Streptomyces longwoodensis]|uniref:alpha/beta fold hydrolase n=1 Tax=Streptomyces longwoodensis TaxID=68231 RepID=UPI0033EE0C0A